MRANAPQLPGGGMGAAGIDWCINPGLIFVQKAFLLGLFLGELIFRGAYYWKEFCVSKWVGLDNKNSLKHDENSLKQLETANAKSPWAYIREGLFFFLGGGGGGGAYYRNFTVCQNSPASDNGVNISTA